MKQRIRAMIHNQVLNRGITNPAVLGAMEKVDRAFFVPWELASRAYEDGPLPLGEDQTISQPYIVAFMTDRLNLTPQSKVLEIGTGSGYQTAILAEIVREVCTVEISPALAEEARERLESLSYKNIRYYVGDGWYGWEEEAPFQNIILTAAPLGVPAMLLEQLAPGGTMILPRGGMMRQKLLIIRKNKDLSLDYEDSLDVLFVPMKKTNPGMY